MSLNLATILEDAAQRFPENIFLVSEDQTCTYSRMYLWSKKIAGVIASFGIKRGDHVAVVIPNVPEFSAVYFGLLAVGAVVVPINTMFLENEIAYQLEQADVSCVIAWSPFAEKCFNAFRALDECRNLFFLGPQSEEAAEKFQIGESRLDEMGIAFPKTVFALEPLLEKEAGDFDTVQTDPGDTAVILFTSGTTGRPKGAELSHFNMYSNALYATEKIVFFAPGDVLLGILPLFHSFGQTVVQNAVVVGGATTVLVPQFEPKKALAQIEQYKVTFICAVPTMFHLMIQNQKRHPFDVSSLRQVVSGGAPLPRTISEEFKIVFGVDLQEGYGLTETSPISNFTARGELVKPHSIGPQAFGCHVRIKREDGSFAETEEVGEVVIRGHNVMKGYYKDPLATQLVYQNGWFHTGDLGRVDSDGYFYIVGRKKDMIIRGGMNIYPREIEEVLLRYPGVKEAAVIGIPDETLSENVFAYVILNEGVECTSEELLRYCREQLAAFKCPKIVRFLDQFPKTSTGKVLKQNLREMAK